jgi:hypothetical protein
MKTTPCLSPALASALALRFWARTAGRGRVGGLTGLTQLDPASIVIARPHHAGSTISLGGGGSGGGVAALKWLQRPSRGNVVRERHGLASLKGVQFAEQVRTLAGCSATLSA